MRQVEYYFSNQNLWKDAYLLTEMSKDPQAFVPLHTILTLNKVSRLSTDPAVLQSAVRLSSKLQLSDDGSKLRRIQPLPPYDQLRDAHRSLYVEHLPAGSTVKTVKRMFGLFGKVTYVLRADHITSASPLNASPRLSPLIAPASPLQPSSAGMPRLSLGSTQPLSVGGGLTVPSSSASDSADGVFTSAFVQFEKASSMQQAVDMIQAQQRAAKERAAVDKKSAASAVVTNGHGSPMINRRSIVGGSPALAGRALGGEQLGSTLAMLRQTQNERVPHINDIIFTPPHTIRTITPTTPNPSSATSSPAITASSPSTASHDPVPFIDLNRPSTPNTPNSPPATPLDANTPLPATLLAVYVQPKGEYIHEQEEKAERERERQAVREKEQKKERSWRSAVSPAAQSDGGEAKEAAAATTTVTGVAGMKADDGRESEVVMDEDPIIKKMKEDARLKQRSEDREKEKEREREKEYRRQHLSERVQERHAHQEQLREREKQQHEQLKQQEIDNIIHISPRPSPRPSPVMRPSPSPILIAAQSPASLASLSALSLGGAHSPSLSPSLPPTGLGGGGPRFSLTKRTSVVAASVASHFALGPDAPDSKGFNGRGRGKILPLALRGDNGAGVGGSMHGGQPAVQPPTLS